MSQQQATHLRSLYRRILRELPSRPITTPSPIQKRLRSQLETPVSQPPDSMTSEATQASLAAAEQMTQYLHAQRTYTTLVERYNPGMNMTEEDRTRLSARAVGMELPREVREMLGGGGGGGGGGGRGENGEGKS